jgi:hypothetical protein
MKTLYIILCVTLGLAYGPTGWFGNYAGFFRHIRWLDADQRQRLLPRMANELIWGDYAIFNYFVLGWAVATGLYWLMFRCGRKHNSAGRGSVWLVWVYLASFAIILAVHPHYTWRIIPWPEQFAPILTAIVAATFWALVLSWHFAVVVGEMLKAQEAGTHTNFSNLFKPAILVALGHFLVPVIAVFTAGLHGENTLAIPLIAALGLAILLAELGVDAMIAARILVRQCKETNSDYRQTA